MLQEDKKSPAEDKSRTATNDSGELEEPEDEEVPLEPDVYGAAMFSIIQDFQEIFGGHDTDDRPLSLNITRLMFTNTVLLANYGLQFGMLYFIKAFVVEPAIDDAEANGEESIVTSHPIFLGCILALWVISILIEARRIERLAKSIMSVPKCDSVKDMVEYEDGEATESDDKYSIRQLTRATRGMLVLMIVIPKLFIAAGLGVLGFQWLAATNSPADLILNALALEFVVAIDESLFDALLPKAVKTKVEQTVLLLPASKLQGTKAEKIAKMVSSEFAMYRRSFFYYFAPPAIAFAFISYKGQEADQ